MRIDIYSTDANFDREIETRIHRKLNLGLSRIDLHIRSVEICLSDVITAEGIVTNYCKFTFSFFNMTDLVIKESQADIYSAIDRAIQKSSRAISRELKNRKTI